MHTIYILEVLKERTQMYLMVELYIAFHEQAVCKKGTKWTNRMEQKGLNRFFKFLMLFSNANLKLSTRLVNILIINTVLCRASR